MAMIRYGLAGLSLLLALASPCAAKDDKPAPVTVFAAASLKESLDEVGRLWALRSGQRVVISYGASSALARQIEQGAPADVFISADGEWMDYLDQRNLTADATRFNLVGNRLVVVAPAGSPVVSLPLQSVSAWLAALGKEGRLAVAETTAVPAGRYARAALENAGAWTAVSTRLAQSDNVRAALAFVARAESPLGIVYSTDALAEPKVRVVATFAPGDHPAIIYPAARTRAADPARADPFLAFLQSAQALGVFQRFGFTKP